MKSYVEFTVWNWPKERPATEEEIKEHVRIVYCEGVCIIETDEEYGFLTE